MVGSKDKGRSSFHIDGRLLGLELQLLTANKTVVDNRLPAASRNDFIRMRSIELDPGADYTRRGISLMIGNPKAEGSAMDGQEPEGGLGLGLGADPGTLKLSISAENIKMMDLLAEIAEKAALDAYVTSRGIWMVPEGSNPLLGVRDDVEIMHVIRKASGPAGDTERAK